MAAILNFNPSKWTGMTDAEKSYNAQIAHLSFSDAHALVELPKFREDFDNKNFWYDTREVIVGRGALGVRNCSRGVVTEFRALVEKIHVAVPAAVYEKICTDATELLMCAALGLLEIACEQGFEPSPLLAREARDLDRGLVSERIALEIIEETQAFGSTPEKGKEIAKIWRNRRDSWIMKGAYREAVASFDGPNPYADFTLEEDPEAEDHYLCDPPEMSVEGFPGW